MSDQKQKPERFDAYAVLNGFDVENKTDTEKFVATGLKALETISAQLNYLIQVIIATSGIHPDTLKTELETLEQEADDE